MIKGKEVPTPISDRVYSKHRRMLTVIQKKLKMKSRATALRHAIEETYALITG